MTESTLLTLKEVQQITKLGRTTVYELVRNGELATVRIGLRSVRVRRAALEQFIADREHSASDDHERGLASAFNTKEASK